MRSDPYSWNSQFLKNTYIPIIPKREDSLQIYSGVILNSCHILGKESLRRLTEKKSKRNNICASNEKPEFYTIFWQRKESEENGIIAQNLDHLPSRSDQIRSKERIKLEA